MACFSSDVQLLADTLSTQSESEHKVHLVGKDGHVISNRMVWVLVSPLMRIILEDVPCCSDYSTVMLPDFHIKSLQYLVDLLSSGGCDLEVTQDINNDIREMGDLLILLDLKKNVYLDAEVVCDNYKLRITGESPEQQEISGIDDFQNVTSNAKEELHTDLDFKIAEIARYEEIGAVGNNVDIRSDVEVGNDVEFSGEEDLISSDGSNSDAESDVSREIADIMRSDDEEKMDNEADDQLINHKIVNGEATDDKIMNGEAWDARIVNVEMTNDKIINNGNIFVKDTKPPTVNSIASTLRLIRRTECLKSMNKIHVNECKEGCSPDPNVINETKHTQQDEVKSTEQKMIVGYTNEEEVERNEQDMEIRHNDQEQEIQREHNEQEIQREHNEQEIQREHNEQEIQREHNEQDIQREHNEQEIQREHNEQEIERAHTEQEMEIEHVKQKMETEYNDQETEMEETEVKIETGHNKQKIETEHIEQKINAEDTNEEDMAEHTKQEEAELIKGEEETEHTEQEEDAEHTKQEIETEDAEKEETEHTEQEEDAEHTKQEIETELTKREEETDRTEQEDAEHTKQEIETEHTEKEETECTEQEEEAEHTKQVEEAVRSDQSEHGDLNCIVGLDWPNFPQSVQSYNSDNSDENMTLSPGTCGHCGKPYNEEDNSSELYVDLPPANENLGCVRCLRHVHCANEKIDHHCVFKVGYVYHMCHECHRFFSERCVMLAHKQQHTSGRNKLVCPICSEIKPSLLHLIGHIRMHTNEYDWCESDCNENEYTEQFTGLESYIKPFIIPRRLKGQRKFRSERARMNWIRERTSDLENISPNENKTKKCVPKLKLKISENGTEIINSEPQKSTKKNYSERNFKYHCREKYMYQKVCLEKVNKLHNQKKKLVLQIRKFKKNLETRYNHQCKKCGRRLKRKSSLIVHEEYCFTGQRCLQCPFCNYLGKSAILCERHICVNHTKEAKFMCKYCSKPFLYRANYAQHVDQHERKNNS